MYQPMMTPPMPHRMVSQIGMLSLSARSNKLAKQANDDARDDHSDDLHVFLLGRLLALSKQPLSSYTRILARPVKWE